MNFINFTTMLFQQFVSKNVGKNTFNLVHNDKKKLIRGQYRNAKINFLVTLLMLISTSQTYTCVFFLVFSIRICLSPEDINIEKANLIDKFQNYIMSKNYFYLGKKTCVGLLTVRNIVKSFFLYYLSLNFYLKLRHIHHLHLKFIFFINNLKNIITKYCNKIFSYFNHLTGILQIKFHIQMKHLMNKFFFFNLFCF